MPEPNPRSGEGGRTKPISFDRIASKYDETRGYPDEVMDEILSGLERVLRKGLPILDVGVGTGRFAHPLQARGFMVVGVDVSQKMMAIAKDKGTENLVCGDACLLPFVDKAFSHSMSVHVMHLISSWKCALAEIARVTTESFVSVAFEKEESELEEFRRLYDETCEELGYKVRHPGLRERELPEILPPDSVNLVKRHEQWVNADELIEEYESRTYSSQWDVPEDIHSQAIDALRERYGGADQLLGKERISILEWRADRLGRAASEE